MSPKLGVLVAIISSFLLAAIPVKSATADQTPAPPDCLSVPVFQLPREMTLCGEPVPLGRQDVFEMLDREFVVAVYDRSQVIMWLKRARRYFPLVEARLKERNMPEDLKYVAIVESALKTYTYSAAGAVGPWQFMPKTAERYGLRVDEWIDERLNFERATEGSLSYLQEVYKALGNWTLAIAAYNCGERRLFTDMKEQAVASFYDLNLPLETERYIFRILAAKLVLATPEACGYAVPAESLYSPVECDTVEFAVPCETHITAVASLCGTTLKTVKEMNPEIKKNSIPAGQYRLKIPKGTGEQFKANLVNLKPRNEASRRRSSNIGKGG